MPACRGTSSAGGQRNNRADAAHNDRDRAETHVVHQEPDQKQDPYVIAARTSSQVHTARRVSSPAPATVHSRPRTGGPAGPQRSRSRRRLRPRASNRSQNGSDGNSLPQSGPDQTVVAAVLDKWHPDPDSGSLRLRRQPEMLPGTAGCVYRRPTGVPPTQWDPVPAAAAGCHSKIGYAGTDYPPRRRPHLTRIYLRRDDWHGA